MDEKQYIEVRLDDQIAWFDARSQQNCRWYAGLRLGEITAAALIPLLIGYVSRGGPPVENAVALLGVSVAVIAGALSLYRFQELWIQYRSTCETLRHEKLLYLTRTEPYNVEQPFPLLVNRIEALISKEHTSWSQYIRRKREDNHG